MLVLTFAIASIDDCVINVTLFQKKKKRDYTLLSSLPALFLSFLFHGDGKAIGMPVQQKMPIYDTPKPSVDSLPPSYNRRSSASASSGYHSQTNLVTSPTSNPCSPSVRSETLPPVIHADQHPGRLGRQVSAPCDINPVLPRRTVSQPTPAGTYTYNTPRSSYHSDDPAVFDGSFPSEDDLSSGYPAGSLDHEGVDGGHPPPISAGAHPCPHHRRRLGAGATHRTDATPRPPVKPPEGAWGALLLLLVVVGVMSMS